jgi:predicted lactoylglutathione lyase
MASKIFVNLPVKNLSKSIEFFTSLATLSINNSPMRPRLA